MSIGCSRWRVLSSRALLLLAGLMGCGGGSGPSDVVITLSPTDLSFEAVGESQQLTATVTENGQPVPSPTLTWSSSDGSVATVSQAGLVTSTGQGDAVVTAESGDGSSSATVTVDQTVTALTQASGNEQCAGAGQPLAQPLVATAQDAQGSPVPGVSLQFAVTQGSGSVTPEEVETTEDGTGSATFTLGAVPGEAQAVTVTVVGTSISTTFTASFPGGPTTSVEAFAGNGQSAPVGAFVPTDPAVLVADANGCGVAGVQVSFGVTGGGGSVTGGAQITNAAGVASVGGWTLGSGGINTMNATVDALALDGEPVVFVATTPPSTGYDLRVRYLGDYSTDQLLAFAQAEVRWEELVTGDLTDVAGDIAARTCGRNSPAASGPFDDLTIFVTIETIDGAGGVLGQAGPCFVRDAQGNSSVVGDKLPVIGRMQLDVDDLEALEVAGSLQAVILHEMGHVLGFGTRWDAFGLLVDPADSDPTAEDPHFIGAQAIAAFNAAGGGPYTGQKVPVMDAGGVGTINSHWRDEVFDAELMTGFLNPGFNPLSAISVRSLQDMGYTVSVAGTDAFAVDLTPIRMAGRQRGRQLINDIISDPIRKITLDGRVVGVIRR
jgi:Bacterial Ig-like domain (group 2)/Leishmanolysin